MAAQLEHIGGRARPASDGRAQLEWMLSLTDAAEGAEWRRDHETGRLVIVALDLFAQVTADGGVARIEGPTIEALSFVVPHCEENLVHVREVIQSSVVPLADALAAAGVRIAADELLGHPVVAELAPELEQLLR